MFQYPSLTPVYEHGFPQSVHYDKFRKPGVEVINNLNCKVAKLKGGERVPLQEYYNRVFNSKIIFAPFGYGEMAPRDLEAAMFGAILVKPDTSYIDTTPNVFIDGETYIACKHNFSDLEEKIDKILGNVESHYYIIENARKKFIESYTPENLALHLYKVFESLNTVEIE